MTDDLRSDFPVLSGPTRALTPLAPVLGHGDGASGVDGGAGGDAGGGAES